jgi:hypothetical protein
MLGQAVVVDKPPIASGTEGFLVLVFFFLGPFIVLIVV